MLQRLSRPADRLVERGLPDPRMLVLLLATGVIIGLGLLPP